MESRPFKKTPTQKNHNSSTLKDRFTRIVQILCLLFFLNSGCTMIPNTDSVGVDKDAGMMTAIVTPTMLPTPRMPLSDSERDETLINWLKNPPCELPCWWRASPGESTRIEILEFLLWLNVDIDESETTLSFSLVDLLDSQFGEPFGVRYYFDDSADETLNSIHIELPSTHFFSARKLIEKTGAPDDVLLSSYLFSSSGHSYFDYVFRNWGVGYVAAIGDTVPYESTSDWTDYATSCLNAENSMELDLWSPDTPVIFGSPSEYGLSHSPNEYVLLEEASDINVMTLVDELLTETTEVCIAVPIRE